MRRYGMRNDAQAAVEETDGEAATLATTIKRNFQEVAV